MRHTHGGVGSASWHQVAVFGPEAVVRWAAQTRHLATEGLPPLARGKVGTQGPIQPPRSSAKQWAHARSGTASPPCWL
jgi:hypothetical protein